MRVRLRCAGDSELVRSGVIVRLPETWEALLATASAKLPGGQTMSRCFDREGDEFTDLDLIEPDDVLYFTSGADFVHPAASNASPVELTHLPPCSLPSALSPSGLSELSDGSTVRGCLSPRMSRDDPPNQAPGSAEQKVPTLLCLRSQDPEALELEEQDERRARVRKGLQRVPSRGLSVTLAELSSTAREKLSIARGLKQEHVTCSVPPRRPPPHQSALSSVANPPPPSPPTSPNSSFRKVAPPPMRPPPVVTLPASSAPPARPPPRSTLVAARAALAAESSPRDAVGLRPVLTGEVTGEQVRGLRDAFDKCKGQQDLLTRRSRADMLDEMFDEVRADLSKCGMLIS